MKCIVCKQEINEYSKDTIILNPDGDTVCNTECYISYNKDVKNFISNNNNIDIDILESIGVFNQSKDKNSLIAELYRMSSECGKDNWDGEGALALDPFILHITENVIQSLDSNIPLPEITPEPDGCISLDWIISKNKEISASISKTRYMPYAWRNHNEHGSSVVLFDHKSLPKRLIYDLNIMYNLNTTPQSP